MPTPGFKINDQTRIWQIAFWLLVPAYCLVYAPFGINETDGGFLSGLAWQVLNGKVLYADVVYVRPPLPVWLRAFSMVLLPDNFAVLGERWLFYLQVAAYVLLASDVLAPNINRWKLAVFGFVVCVHNYPATAWHTTDGILMAVLSVWLWRRRNGYVSAVFSGVFMVGALLCKQSFYPFFLIWLLFLVIPDGFNKRFAAGLTGAMLTIAAFVAYLTGNQLFESYLSLTSGAATGGQALQHGLIDYLNIKPWLAGISVVLMLPVMLWLMRGKRPGTAQAGYACWLVLLVGSFVFQLYKTQDYTVPFAQSRLMFLLATAYGLWITLEIKRHSDWKRTIRDTSNYWALLGISWCAAVSWGYNLPILFAVPWVYAALRVGDRLFENRASAWLSAGMLVLLLCVFRYGYEFVYRDGQRSSMNKNMGEIFPKLTGIYSDDETWNRYNDLKTLALQWPQFKTLPAFPQSNWLTDTRPVFPLDWVVQREMNARAPWVRTYAANRDWVYFIDKTWIERIKTDAELALSREILEKGIRLKETSHFLVIRYE